MGNHVSGNRPILMAPKFGLDDGSSSNFDAALVLATMLTSQLHEGNLSEPPQAAATVHGQNEHESRSRARSQRDRPNVSEHPSDHTRIWSELSGAYFYNVLMVEGVCSASKLLMTLMCRKCCKKW